MDLRLVQPRTPVHNSLVQQIKTRKENAQGMAVWLYTLRRRVATVAVCLLAAWLLAFHVVSGSNGWTAYRRKKVEYQRLQQEVQQLQNQNDQLEHHIKALKTDPEAIEREAREQFRYAKPGEVIYVLPAQKPAVVQSPESGVAQNAKP